MSAQNNQNISYYRDLFTSPENLINKRKKNREVFHKNIKEIQKKLKDIIGDDITNNDIFVYNKYEKDNLSEDKNSLENSKNIGNESKEINNNNDNNINNNDANNNIINKSNNNIDTNINTNNNINKINESNKKIEQNSNENDDSNKIPINPTIKYIDFILKRKSELKSEWDSKLYKKYFKYVCNCFSCCLKSEYTRRKDDIEKEELNDLLYDEDLIIFRNNFYTKEVIREKDYWYCEKTFIIFSIFSFFHFFSISQVNGIMYSLFGETKRSFFNYFDAQYFKDRRTEDNFYKILINSNLNDSSQVNFFFLTSFLTPFIINFCKKIKIYIVLNLLNLVVLVFVYFFDYLDENKINNKNYDFDDFIIRVFIPLALLYIFTGFIASFPFLLLEISPKYRNKNFYWILNLLILLAILSKNLLNNYLSIFFFKKCLLLGFIILYLLGEIIFLFYFCCNTDIFEEEEKKDEPLYILGKLIIKSDFMTVIITVKDFKKYFFTILNKKTIILIFINICTRTSKLKYKTEYKNFYNNVYFLILNFILSYLVFILIYLIFKFYKNKWCIPKEKYLLNIIILENSLMSGFSFISFIFSFFSNKTIIFIGKILFFIAIGMGGAINFIFSEYYSTQYIEYLSISGIIAVGQLLFRIIEFLLEPLKDKFWYFWQIFFSFVGIILTNYYKNNFKSFVEEKEFSDIKSRIQELKMPILYEAS